MAVCPYCKGEMMDEISCRPDALVLGGVTVHPIRWGEEGDSKGRRIDFCCRDCGTPPGGIHHPGCCVERCPGCRGQALGCPCFDLDEEPDDELDRRALPSADPGRSRHAVPAAVSRPPLRPASPALIGSTARGTIRSDAPSGRGTARAPCWARPGPSRPRPERMSSAFPWGKYAKGSPHETTVGRAARVPPSSAGPWRSMRPRRRPLHRPRP